LKDVHIYGKRLYSPPRWQDDVASTLWLKLLRPFAAAKNLYFPKGIVPHIAPALENIFLNGFWPSGPLHEGIEKFVAARRLTSHPVAVSPMDEGRHREVVYWY
jgi:hypothetical protein